jgi:hypothetical protein
MKKMLCVLALTLPLCGTLVTTPITPAHADRRGEDRTRIRLTGAPINNIRPQGNAEYRVRPSENRRKLKIEATSVALPDGTVLTFKVNGVVLGTRTLNLGRAELELDTNDGRTPPAIVQNDMVQVTTLDATGTEFVVVSGKF